MHLSSVLFWDCQLLHVRLTHCSYALTQWKKQETDNSPFLEERNNCSELWKESNKIMWYDITSSHQLKSQKFTFAHNIDNCVLLPIKENSSKRSYSTIVATPSKTTILWAICLIKWFDGLLLKNSCLFCSSVY